MKEFVVLLPAIELKNAVFLAEKLRSIETLEIDTVGKVTASFGVTQGADGADTIGSCYKI